MSRSGYSDECEYLDLYRGAVRRATNGARGQHFLRKLLAALEAMPVKRLIADEINDGKGDVCALGAVDPDAKSYDAEDLARHFGIAQALAAEIVFENDEVSQYRYRDGAPARRETPEERWTRVRAWVASQILPEQVS